MIEQFRKIYKQQNWGKSRLYPEHGGSGMGSSVEYVRELIYVLEKYILDEKVTSFLDIGCGECEWQRTINWEKLDCEYIGIELLPDVVERVNSDLRKYKNMTIIQGDCLKCSLPNTDIVFIKEVFQHWPIYLTNRFIEKLQNSFNACLTYNCDVSPSFFRYQIYQYFIINNLEVHDEVIDAITTKLCNIYWDTDIGGFRPCKFNTYGDLVALFKWKWHFPASLVSIEQIPEESKINNIMFNFVNVSKQIEEYTGGIYKDSDTFKPTI